MKKRVRVYGIVLVLSAMLLTMILPACSTGNSSGNTEQGTQISAVRIPELGKWHAEVLFSDMKDAMPFIPRLLIAIACGNTAFEVDLLISDDGTFAYETNTKALIEGATGTASDIVELFSGGQTLISYIENAIEMILPEVVQGKDRDCYGVFRKEDDGMLILTKTDGQVLYFKVFGKTLVQMDADGKTILTFKRP